MLTKPFKKCILHIGTEKTGTTTLQTLLGLNRSVLGRQGYFVSRSLSPFRSIANHRHLTTMFMAPSKLNDALRRAEDLVTLEQVMAYRSKIQQRFTDEVANVDGSMPVLLLSNEHCHSRLTSSAEVRDLHNFLGAFASDFQIVVYIRPQHELAMSAYDQALKSGRFDIDILPNFKDQKSQWVKRNYFDYADLTSRWSKVFGEDKLTLRIYTPSDLIGGDIVEDFLSVINCDKEDLIIPKNQNVSISCSLQPAMNAANRYGKSHPGSIQPLTRARLVAALQRLSHERGRRPQRMEAMKFLQLFEHSNERVRQQYLPDRTALFNVDLESFPMESEQAPDELTSLVEALIGIVEREHR